MITDSQGIIEYVNPAFETLTGYTREEVRRKTPRILKSGKQGPETYQEDVERRFSPAISIAAFW